MIMVTVTRRCRCSDGTLGAKAVVIQIDGEEGLTTASVYPNGCRGLEAAGVLRRTPSLVAAEAAIRALVDEVRTTLGDSL